VRKVDVPFVWRYIGALDLVAQVTEIALIDDFPVVCLFDAVEFECFGFVYEVKQCGEGVA
jgi:hypothetical protein